jgi:hypothetical protein
MLRASFESAGGNESRRAWKFELFLVLSCLFTGISEKNAELKKNTSMGFSGGFFPSSGGGRSSAGGLSGWLAGSSLD